MSASVVVIGSLNMDMVLRVAKHPKPGETLFTDGIVYNPGGKGANQAVAAARMGGDVRMIGKVGGDEHGRVLLRMMREEGIDASGTAAASDALTGLAVITVDEAGENSIIVSSGANALVRPGDVRTAMGGVGAGHIVLLQLEIPVETVLAAAQEAKRRGALVVLDPAPAPVAPLPEALLRAADLIVPNQHEAEALCGVEVRGRADAERAAAKLLAMGAGGVIVKLGAEGALIAERGKPPVHAAGRQVRAVDTTAAGDTFAGALAVAIAEGRPLPEAVAFANKAAALSVTKPGAMASIPRRRDVDALD